jgi:FkbM family methyltransferase
VLAAFDFAGRQRAKHFMQLLLGLLNRLPSSWLRAAAAARGRWPLVKSATDWIPRLIRNREGRIQKGLGRGLLFNGGNSAVGFLLGTHDLEVQYVLSRLLQPGMTFFDLGANVGFMSMLAARQVGPKGTIVCFEPLAVNAAQIKQNSNLNGFTAVAIHEIALGKEDGEAEFLLSESPTWGRLAQAGAAPKQSGVVRVPVRTLDSLAQSGQLPDPQFIKMDVEGVEADVILGGKEFLSRTRPVMVIELHHTYDAVMNALKSIDYDALPVPGTGAELGTDKEFQLLAFPRSRTDIQGICEDLAAGKMVFA